MCLRQEGYWDQHYELELKNFEEDGDEGEVWFGKGLSRRIADWLVEQLSRRIDQPSTIIDVGCGNGFTLYTLVDKYRTKLSQSTEISERLKLTGIDYSRNSIDLSFKIMAAKNLDSMINLMQCDFLKIDQLNSVVNNKKFDFIVDIGTFDAICLLAHGELEAAKLKYLRSLNSISKCGTKFILASCNHTEEELVSLFGLENSPDLNPNLIDRIETPKIQFGGKEGSQVTCLIFDLLGIEK